MIPKRLLFACLLVLGAMLCAGPVSGAINIIPQGGDVFIGEQSLVIPVPSGSVISWYSGEKTPGVSPPDAMIAISDATHFYVSPVDFTGRTGNWYIGYTTSVAFVVIDPSVDVKVWDQNAQKDVTGKTVTRGHFANFRIDSNLYTISERPGYDPSTDGFMTIKVKNTDGSVYSKLFQSPSVTIPLSNLSDNAGPFFWVPANDPVRGWNTGLYNPGMYTVWARCNANKMNDNYDVSGKTISSVKTVSIGFPVPVPAGPSATITPPVPQHTITPPTPKPTITPPTPQPTITPPTPKPTITPPTPQPTITPPTPGPTVTSARWESTGELMKNYSGNSSSFQGTVLLPKRTFTETDNGKTFFLNKNDIVAVSLHENPTTGFRWVVNTTQGIGVLKNTFKRPEVIIPPDSPVTGQGGVRTWTLKMVQTGLQTFTGIYKQPWMPDNENNIPYTITFNVK
jgi:predicted secreted protein